MTTETASTNPAQVLRAFLRANSKADGAMEALDALHDLESVATDAAGTRERERLFSAAIVGAQARVNAAFKDKMAGNYKVAETEQLLVLCREQMTDFALALEVGSSEVVLISGTPFLRIHFGLRHECGFVKVDVRDFPIVSKGGGMDVAIRQANTSALGYYLRDAFALPRLKDEGEAAAAAEARSGPRRSATVAATPRPQPQTRPAAPPLSEKAATRVAKIQAAPTIAALDELEGRVADLRSALDSEEPPHPLHEVEAMERACAARREALS